MSSFSADLEIAGNTLHAELEHEAINIANVNISLDENVDNDTDYAIWNEYYYNAWNKLLCREIMRGRIK